MSKQMSGLLRRVFEGGLMFGEGGGQDVELFAGWLAAGHELEAVSDWVGLSHQALRKLARGFEERDIVHEVESLERSVGAGFANGAGFATGSIEVGHRGGRGNV